MVLAAGMLMAIGLLVLAGDIVLATLIGENVCQEERRSTVNVTEYFIRNTTLRNYQWCMNVPPRCSFYTTRLINESRIVEKEISEFIDKCCSGYIEENNRCVPVCPDCNNGTCIEGKCSCFRGYKGDLCDIACDNLEWGENCKFKCNCNGSICHSETGNCDCPPGWTGNECQLPCSSGFFGPNCQQSCPCDSNSCDSITGQCLTSSSTDPTPITTKIQFINNGKLEISKAGPEVEITETAFPFFEDEDKAKIGPVNNYISKNERVYASTSGPVEIAKPKAKVDNEVDVGKDKENFLNDDARRGNAEPNKNDLVNSASAATAISAGIIIVAGVIVAANHFKKGKEQGKEAERSKGVSTVAVYTHSIFHTPLPEPPVFENPIFASPVETNPSGEGRFETHVVCSMNFPAHTSNKDLLYDHPPSTGSYRAASIPEPPDIDMSPISTQSEPLYDEIPSGVLPIPVSPPSYKSSSLYMNTCGKTRF